jgi:hypothetical protein
MDLDIGWVLRELMDARAAAVPPFLRPESAEARAFQAGYLAAVDVLESCVAQVVAQRQRREA